MAEAARPGATVSAPCDLAQLTTPTYARGRLAKLRREAGRKGSGRCEMARACCAFMSSRGCHRCAIQAPWLALARIQLPAGLSLWAALCADARHPPLSTARQHQHSQLALLASPELVGHVCWRGTYLPGGLAPPVNTSTASLHPNTGVASSHGPLPPGGGGAEHGSHPLVRWSSRSSPHPTLALTLWPSPSSVHPGQALSFRTFERDAKRAVDAVAAKAQLDAP